MKAYFGERLQPEERTLSDVTVFAMHDDGTTRPLKQVMRHSPTGMNWGYGGSGPADTALSILADLFAGRFPIAERLHQDFKWDFVAGWGDGWYLPVEKIEEWLVKKTGKNMAQLCAEYDTDREEVSDDAEGKEEGV